MAATVWAREVGTVRATAVVATRPVVGALAVAGAKPMARVEVVITTRRMYLHLASPW